MLERCVLVSRARKPPGAKLPYVQQRVKVGPGPHDSSHPVPRAAGSAPLSLPALDGHGSRRASRVAQERERGAHLGEGAGKQAELLWIGEHLREHLGLERTLQASGEART